MKQTNDFLMFVLIGLASIITIAALLQRPVNWGMILSAGGFTLFTVALIGSVL